MKKGSKWALSCVATSAAVLSFITVSNSVLADTTDTQNTAQTSTQVSENQDQSSNDNNSQSATDTLKPVYYNQTTNSYEAVTDQNQNTTASAQVSQPVAQTQQSTPATQAVTQTNNNTGAVSYATNNAVPDGGNVQDDYGNTQNNLLGYAAYFHIFAKNAHLKAHTNGNIAVGNLTGEVNFGTNIKEELLDKDISYIQNFNNLANSSFVSGNDSRSNKVVFGNDVDLDVSNPNRPIANGINIDHLTADEVYQDKDGNKYIDFDEAFNDLNGKSEGYSLLDPNVVITRDDFPDRNNRVINLADYQPVNNQIVINLDPDVLTDDVPLTIAGISPTEDGTTVIINVDTKGANPYDIQSQIKIVYADSAERPDPMERPNQETEYFGDNHLLWNFYDSTESNNIYNGVINVNRPFQGSILAPSATINANQNLDGNIIAENVNVNAESHRWDLQDNSDKETEYEIPMTLPGQVELPGTTDPENPGTTDPENPGTTDPENPGTTDPENPGTTDPENPGTTEPENPGTTEPETPDTTDPEEPEDNNGDKDTDESEGEIITNGGSESSHTDSEDAVNEDTVTENGILSGVETANKNESKNSSAQQNNGSNTGLPQTGVKDGMIASTLGVILMGFLGLFGIKRRKRS